MPARSSRKLSGMGLRTDDGKAKGKRIKRVSLSGKINKVKENLKKECATRVLDLKIPSNKTNLKVSSMVNGSTASPRTGGVFLGFHASSAGGVHNAVTQAMSVGAQCLALFLRPQRSWAAPPLAPGVAGKFRSLCKEHGIPPHLILPHGSYLLNLGSPDKGQRDKSLELLTEELRRCKELGITMFNIHPGSSCGKISRDECIKNIADGVNMVHKRTADSGVKIVLENMSCQGHTIGGDFTELKKIIEKVEDKSRVAVCLDTCHAMAAGYDLSTEEGFDRFISEYERKVGWEWLVAMHVNDSTGPAGCHRDRHANIGEGSIGLEGFRRIMNCKHFTDIPLILETPLHGQIGIELYRREMQTLIKMVGEN